MNIFSYYSSWGPPGPYVDPLLWTFSIFLYILEIYCFSQKVFSTKKM